MKLLQELPTEAMDNLLKLIESYLTYEHDLPKMLKILGISKFSLSVEFLVCWIFAVMLRILIVVDSTEVDGVAFKVREVSMFITNNS